MAVPSENVPPQGNMPANLKKPVAPSSPKSGYIRLNPHTAYISTPINTIIVFFVRMLTVFLARVRPASRQPKPRCIEKTSTAAIRIQRLFTVNISGETTSATSSTTTAASSWPIAWPATSAATAPTPSSGNHVPRVRLIFSTSSVSGAIRPNRADPAHAGRGSDTLFGRHRNGRLLLLQSAEDFPALFVRVRSAIA